MTDSPSNKIEIKTTILDQNVRWLLSTVEYLESCMGISVCAYGTELMQLMQAFQRSFAPDVAVINIDSIDDYRSWAILVMIFKHSKFVFITSGQRRVPLETALLLEPDGIQLKGIPPEKLHIIITDVYRGYTVIDPQIEDQLRCLMMTSTREGNVNAGPYRAQLIAGDIIPPPPRELTGREDEILNLLAEGRTNAEIAYSLGISSRTVEFHVSNILTKVNLSSRIELAVLAPWLHREKSSKCRDV